MEEIINRVAQSVLEVFDLEDYYPAGNRIEIDVAHWLEGGFLLKEKDFREALKNHNWEQYQGALIAIYCSTDAIIPAWAKILITVYLTPYAKKIVLGKVSDLDSVLYQEILPKLDYSIYLYKPVILKGCAKKPVPEGAYILAVQYLQAVAKSISYGEACSAVPLFKKAKS